MQESVISPVYLLASHRSAWGSGAWLGPPRTIILALLSGCAVVAETFPRLNVRAPALDEPHREIQRAPEDSDNNASTPTWIKVGSCNALGVSDYLFLDRNRDISSASHSFLSALAPTLLGSK